MDNIVTLAGKFKSDMELQEYCNAQYLSLQSALNRVRELETEIEHLKELLNSTTKLLPEKVEKLVVPTEQAICEVQITRLREQALMRDLTLEETKRLDLLVKNLYLARGQATACIKAEGYRLPENVTEAELVKLAQVEHSQKPPEDEFV